MVKINRKKRTAINTKGICPHKVVHRKKISYNKTDYGLDRKHIQSGENYFKLERMRDERAKCDLMDHMKKSIKSIFDLLF